MLLPWLRSAETTTRYSCLKFDGRMHSDISWNFFYRVFYFSSFYFIYFLVTLNYLYTSIYYNFQFWSENSARRKRIRNWVGKALFTFRVLAVLNKMSTKPQPHNLSLQYENNENLLEIASMKLLRFVKMCEEEIKWGENYIVWWKLFYLKPIHSYVRICVTHFWSLTTSRIAFALWSANGRSTVSLSEAISFLFMLFSSRHIFSVFVFIHFAMQTLDFFKSMGEIVQRELTSLTY